MSEKKQSAPFPIRLEKLMPRIEKAQKKLKLDKPVKFIKLAIEEKLENMGL